MTEKGYDVFAFVCDPSLGHGMWLCSVYVHCGVELCASAWPLHFRFSVSASAVWLRYISIVR